MVNFGRARHGLDLTRESWRVLSTNRELLIFPCLSVFLLAAVIAAAVGAEFFAPEAWDWFAQQGAASQLAWSAVGLFLQYSAAIFLNTAMVSCALIRFAGGKPALGAGLSIAVRRLPQILAWSIVATVVHLVLDEAEERLGWLGKLLTSMIGAGWAFATLLVVPVLAAEGVSPIAALRRSTHLIRQTWGEGLAGNFTIQLISGVAVVALFAIAGAGIGLGAYFESLVLAGVVVATLGVAIFFFLVLHVAMQQVFLTGLYIYATTGTIPQGFSESTMADAFRKRDLHADAVRPESVAPATSQGKARIRVMVSFCPECGILGEREVSICPNCSSTAWRAPSR